MKSKERKTLEKILRKLQIDKEKAKKYLDKKLSLFEKVSSIVEDYVKEKKIEILSNKPLIEGESKKIYRLKNLALIELKPTMYSFTYNRYGIVNGTDNLRLDFWRLFASRLNTTVSDYFVNREEGEFSTIIEDLLSEGIIEEDYPFISNYLGEILIENKRYAITRFAENIPPLEVVWKNYLVGTMKHSLKEVDKQRTRQGKVLNYEGMLPNDIIRFDWRNPLPDKDECIPDEFADIYMNTRSARKVARLASRMLNSTLQEKGYELIDLCYFMNYEGSMIYSEITPDGMRIRKKGRSFDKDLWRAGKDEELINKVWKELYLDLKGDKK